MNAIADVKVRPQVVYSLDAIKRSKDGTIIHRRSTEDIPNVFTDWGVETLFGNTPQNPADFGSAAVGTGSSEPHITDLRLDNFLAGRYSDSLSGISRSFVNNGDGTGYVQISKTITFPVGVAAGNISELGAAFGSIINSSTNLMSRALVVDANGDPTTFEVLSDEELQLTMFFRLHVSLEDVILSNVPIDGDGPDQTITIRPFFLGSGWQWPAQFQSNPQCRALWGEVYNLPSLTGNNGSSSGAGAGQANQAQGTQQGMESYISGSKECVRWARRPTGADQNVVGFEFYHSHSAFGRWAVKLDPGIPKSALHRCTLGMKFIVDNTP